MIDAETLTEMIESALKRNPDPEVSDEAIHTALGIWNAPLRIAT